MYYNNIIYSTSILITNICTCTCICNIKFSDYMYMYMYEEWSSLISCAFGMEAPQGVFFSVFLSYAATEKPSWWWIRNDRCTCTRPLASWTARVVCVFHSVSDKRPWALNRAIIVLHTV